MFWNLFDCIKITVLRLDRPTVIPFYCDLNITIGINLLAIYIAAVTLYNVRSSCYTRVSPVLPIFSYSFFLSCLPFHGKGRFDELPPSFQHMLHAHSK